MSNLTLASRRLLHRCDQPDFHGRRISFIIGPPCSGKTTLAQVLAVERGAAYLSSGQVARESPNKHVKHALETGAMAPPGIMDAICIERILQIVMSSSSKGDELVVDGYPRYWEQLTDIFYALVGIDLQFLSIDLERDEAARRAPDRGRRDDAEATFDCRWNAFEYLTQPILDYLHSRDLLYKIDGAQTYRAILTAAMACP